MNYSYTINAGNIGHIRKIRVAMYSLTKKRPVKYTIHVEFSLSGVGVKNQHNKVHNVMA